MVFKLQNNEYKKVKPLLIGLEQHPVINGVVDGNNRGNIYVDDVHSPTVAFIWAINEMFYLVGNSHNESFNSLIESLLISEIMPVATKIGEEDLNLELYPYTDWQPKIKNIFNGRLNVGERVPFVFQKERFLQMPIQPEIYFGYELKKITTQVIENDLSNVIANEILKFWDSLASFFRMGIGYCVIKDRQVIGTCISVFVSKNEYEIGINTYQTEHRGKGLATTMARAFIDECLLIGGTPHWTTESFREDSIAIANKLGFKQLPNYKVYFLPFKEFKNN